MRLPKSERDGIRDIAAMSEEPHLPAPGPKCSPPDPAYVYTSPLERFAGAAVDVIFLHVILIPLRIPAADWSFRQNSVWPAALFVGLYFAFLLLLLLRKGLTPGGLPLGYRVVTGETRFLSWERGLRRLAPYAAIQILGLCRLHAVLQGLNASGESYEFRQMREIIQAHGGLWNMLVIALNGFVVVDLMMVLRSPRNQSLTDKVAGSFVVSPSPS